jgi:hypothetical protein
VTSLNLYDLYWLLLVPGMALLTADSILAPSPQSVTFQQIAKIIFFVALFFSAILERPAIGSDKGRYTGIDELANYLNAKPIATVIYDRWLGWQLGYYMGQWTNKRRVYFPTPYALAQGAAALDETGTRYLIAPVWEDVDAWLAGLRAAQFAVLLETRIAQFEVYAIVPPNHHP